MACGEKQKVWVHVKPHRKRVWKCFDEKPQKRRSKKITRPLNVADFVRAPGYRRSERQEKARNKPKPKPKRIQLRPPARPPRRELRVALEKLPPAKAPRKKTAPTKLMVRLPLKYYNVTRNVPGLPVSQGPIKYAEDYQLEDPTQFGSKKRKRRPGRTKDDPIVID